MNSVDSYSDWIGSEVITETGTVLGWVRKIVDNFENCASAYLVIAVVPTAWLPEILIGTYEISIDEVISSTSKRLIVFDGTEQRVKHSTVGWLERFKFAKPPWQPEVYPVPIPRSWRDDTWDDEPNTGLSPVPTPRQPNPSPMGNEAEIPLE
jgi:hypothetical protein